MNIDTEIWQTIAAMPESLKQELLHYAKYLMVNYSQDIRLFVTLYAKSTDKMPR
ncbi:MAG: DUF2281 domain-containing protein [Microcystis aeruginosa G13-07]|nr:DUF2281 domain-containing protein [Microcystis aeruginosa G13-07]